MAAKMSKGIADRKRSLRFLLSALMGKQAVKIAAVLLAGVRPDLEDGQTVPDFLASIRALGQRLRAVMARLVGIENDLFVLKVRLAELAGERDTLASELARAIVCLRRCVLARYLSPNLVGLALQSPRSYRPSPLLAQTGQITESFAREDLARLLGEAVLEDGSDPRVHAERVEKLGARLSEVLQEIDETRRHFDVAVIAKNETMEEYDVLFLNTARTFEAYCRLAGEPELADRVRPSRRRPGRTEEEPGEEDLPPLGLAEEAREAARGEDADSVSEGPARADEGDLQPGGRHEIAWGESPNPRHEPSQNPKPRRGDTSVLSGRSRRGAGDGGLSC